MQLAFPINAHQNANQRPIKSVPTHALGTSVVYTSVPVCSFTRPFFSIFEGLIPRLGQTVMHFSYYFQHLIWGWYTLPLGPSIKVARILLHWTNVTANYSLPATRLHCRVVFPLRHIWMVLKSKWYCCDGKHQYVWDDWSTLRGKIASFMCYSVYSWNRWMCEWFLQAESKALSLLFA